LLYNCLMNDKKAIEAAAPSVKSGRPPRIYLVKYVNRSLLKTIWILYALIVVLMLLLVDLPFDRLREPLPILPLNKELVVFLAVAIIVMTFYRSKGGITLDERGIRFPNGDFLYWKRIGGYRISVYSDRHGLKRVNFKSREGYKIRLLIEQGNQLDALAEDIKHTLSSFNPPVDTNS